MNCKNNGNPILVLKLSLISQISIYLMIVKENDLKENKKYGKFDGSFVVFSYDTEKKSEFFKRNIYWNDEGHAFFVFRDRWYFLGDFDDTRF